MNVVNSLVISTLITGIVSGYHMNSLRHLSYELIAGYEPLTVVTDHVSQV